MKAIKLVAMAALTACTAYGEGLYQASEEETSSIPLKWSLGMDVVWDDNTTPGGPTDGDEQFSINPYVGVTYAREVPGTTMSLYARTGMVYYFEKPAGTNDDIFGMHRAGFDLNHEFSERLKFTSNYYASYELEPDYVRGTGTNRQSGEYFSWGTDNSFGFRWSERFGTYTGITLSDLSVEGSPNADRFTWTAYNQLRFQLSEQTLLTGTYRYSETTAVDQVSDSTNQYGLIGVEHRVSAITLVILNAGAQFRDVASALADPSVEPYVEFSANTRVNENLSYRGFIRYGVEDNDTVVPVGAITAEYFNKITTRVGVSADYKLSPRLSLYGGVNVITSAFEDGKDILGVAPDPADQDEMLINAYIGTTVEITEYLFGTLTYNFTTSDSDIGNRDYDRNRIAVGLRADF